MNVATPKYNYKKLLSEKHFLKVAARAKKVNGIEITDILYDKDTVIFRCNSVSTPGKKWTQTIKLVALDQHKEIERLKKGVEEGQRDLISHYRKAVRENAVVNCSQISIFVLLETTPRYDCVVPQML